MLLLYWNGVCHGRFLALPRVANSSTVIAFVFTFYILSFVVDLLPSVRTRTRVPQGEKRLEMAHSGPNAPHFGDMTYEQPLAEPGNLDGNYYYRGQRM